MLRKFLKSSIGKGFASAEDDVRMVRKNLKKVGYPAGDDSFGFMDHNLEFAIRGFQKDHDLKNDAIMHPGGETELSLVKKVSETEMPSNPIGDVESEPLAPPPSKKIPGTDIDDESRAEQDIGRRDSGNYDPYNIKKGEYRDDEDIVVTPSQKDMDPWINKDPYSIKFRKERDI